MKIRIAVCDDQETFVSEMEQIISSEMKKMNMDCSIESFTAPEQLIENHNSQAFDIIFLDILMPTMSGFDAASQIRKDADNTNLIFITSKSELVYKSFDYRPFYFIQKNSAEPISESIPNVLNKLMRQFIQNKTIILNDKERPFPVHIYDIMYIKSDKHYLYYVISPNKQMIRIRATISEKATEFEGYDFIQTHKRYLVNLRFLKGINNTDDEIILTDGTKLEFSRNYKKIIEEKYTNYLRSKI